MKDKKNQSIKKSNWRLTAHYKPVFWAVVVLALVVAFNQPSIRSWFSIASSQAFNWVVIQVTNEPGFEWAIDSYGNRVLAAKGDELGKPKNLYIYNTDHAQYPIQVLAEDLPDGDSYLASAKIADKRVVYTRLRSDGQGSSVWIFDINSDDTGGINTLISPEDSAPASKRWRVRPDIDSALDQKIIYQEFELGFPGPVRRGNLVMVDSVPNAIPVLIAPKVAIIGNHWEYEEPSVTISPQIDSLWIVWRDVVGTDLQSLQTAFYAVQVDNPTDITTLLPPTYFPSVGSFTINNGFVVASITTKGLGDATNTNLFSCLLDNCGATLKLVNTKNTYPYIATQPSMIQGVHVVYMVEKPQSDATPVPVHQQWRYHNIWTDEDNLIAELGSSTSTTVLTERYERALTALIGKGPNLRVVSVITRRAAPGGIPSFTDANMFAAVGL